MTKTKFITDELIQQRLTEKGFSEELFDRDPQRACQNVLDHYGVKITSDWSNSADFYIYSDSTADGYEVWITTHKYDEISPSENIHYYDHDLGDALNEFIRYSNGDIDFPDTVYVDDIDAEYINDALENMFFELSERYEEEVIDELTDEGYEQQD
tara:strand:- start:9 stop:473 length:465 start_codon:yes stop_codon:yes gene_type:complete